MQYKESEFYGKLLELINRDLSDKGLKPVDLKRIDYVIKRSQYYNIRRISLGDMKASRLSHSRLLALCKRLGIDLQDILYDAIIKYPK
jgi:DNA-binding Xre family transcriptional regulator